MDILKDLKWTYERTLNKCEIYSMDSKHNYPYYGVSTTFEYPPEFVFDYFKDVEKRKIWDGHNYEHIEVFQECPLNTALLYVKLKVQWPLGTRDLLLNFQVLFDQGKIYMAGKSETHPDCPELPKVSRINTLSGHYLFEPIENGGKDGTKGTKLTYVTEVSVSNILNPYLYSLTSKVPCQNTF